MRVRNRSTFGFVSGVTLLFSLAVGGAGPSAAQELGLAAKKPVVAAACKLCPWGAIADVLKEALKPQGYDLQICYTCSRGNNPRYVVGTMKPPQTDPEGSPPPPNHPIEFGITSGSSVQWMYEGSHGYAKDGGHKELRLIARVDVANYAVMMVKASTGITDLRQIKEKRLPVRIITTESDGNMPILKYYGITKKELESWGGSYVHFVGTLPEDPDAFDVVIMNNLYLGGAPEMRPYYLITAKYDMRFLPMPQDLRESHGEGKRRSSSSISRPRCSAAWMRRSRASAPRRARFMRKRTSRPTSPTRSPNHSTSTAICSAGRTCRSPMTRGS